MYVILYNWAVLQSHKIVIIKASPNPKVGTSRAKVDRTGNYVAKTKSKKIMMNMSING